MNNIDNRRIYLSLAPIYDLLFQPMFATPRRHLVDSLDLQPGERVLIPGIGTGQDLPLLPPHVRAVAGDLSEAMLCRALARNEHRDVHFHISDAQRLPFSDSSFDVVLLFLVLSVVPNGAQSLGEAWRVLRAGGRIAVFDKFVPEGQRLTPVRRMIGAAFRRFGTDPNRTWDEILAGLDDEAECRQQPSLLRGQYRMIWLQKPIH